MMVKNTDYGKLERGIEQYKLSSGSLRWRVRFSDESGKNRSKTFTNVSKARSFYAAVLVSAERGERPSVFAGQESITLAEFAVDIWTPEVKKYKAAATWDRDKRVFHNHILYKLGDRALSQIDTEDILDWKKEREDKGVGAATIAKALSLLSSIFQEAMMRQRTTGVKENPTIAIKKPKVSNNRAVRVYPLEAVEMICQLLRAPRFSDRIGKRREFLAYQDAAFLEIMLQTGMRPAELMALKWADISDDRIIVDKAYGLEGIKETKTGKSRSIPILDTLENDLKILRQKQDRDQAARKNRPSEYVICSATGDHWQQHDKNNWHKRHFKSAARKTVSWWAELNKREKLPEDLLDSIKGLLTARPYELGRHTHSALHLSTGITLIELSQIQGHSVRTLSEVYAHQLTVRAGATAAEEITEARDRVQKLMKTVYQVQSRSEQEASKQNERRMQPV